ncbi:TRAP-type C4-dicarboxylate transport system substrate-binding protein [Paracoccus versutus]|uniref:TRAP-type C4-dicarboxylate transport system substrate-binding protein n=3 Tax=Paracoccus versutus TaxID=34007 RepID=A0AAQ0HJ59_PARVE|nr:TRAP-type C4-dicarboxylate transport system substrate-binding protein [Paracoccus versutus]
MTIAMKYVAAATAVMLAGTTLPAQADDETTLKISHMFSLTHYAWTQAGAPFTQKVAELSGNKLQFQEYPAGQLGKDYISQLNSGLADVVVLVGSYTADKLPLTSVSELPVKYDSACEASGKLWSIIKPGGSLYEEEYKPQGLRPLFVALLPTYKIMTTTKALKSYDEVKGLKIRASGAAMEQTVRALGGVPVQIQGPEISDSLRRGTVDGTFLSYNSAHPYGVDAVVKHGIKGPSLGSTSVVFAMTERKWESLTDDQRTALETAAMQVQPQFCGWMDADEDKARQRMIDEFGYAAVEVSNEETTALQEKLLTVAEAWAERMEEQRKPGRAILEAFQSASPENVD